MRTTGEKTNQMRLEFWPKNPRAFPITRRYLSQCLGEGPVLLTDPDSKQLSDNTIEGHVMASHQSRTHRHMCTQQPSKEVRVMLLFLVHKAPYSQFYMERMDSMFYVPHHAISFQPSIHSLGIAVLSASPPTTRPACG